MKQKTPSAFVVGLAFFSMLFGSGNLIFPLMLGAKYENYFLLSSLAFIITAVFLPLLGVMAMVSAGGRYEKLLSELMPIRYARWFFLIVLVFWIPLGSGPRCVVLAQASINTYSPFFIPTWLFSLFFLSITYFAVQRKSSLIDILGKYLTPIMIISIFFIVLASLFSGTIDKSDLNGAEVFINSLVSGYFTQDLIAAIFFSSTLVGIINISSDNINDALKKTACGGVIAAFLLITVYTALMAASAVHKEHLANFSGDKLVSKVAQLALGTTFGSISSVAVSLACFTTAIALVTVFSQFLSHYIIPKSSTKTTVIITVVIIWFMSLIEFNGIMKLVEPAMKLIYPIIFVLVLRFLWVSKRV